MTTSKDVKVPRLRFKEFSGEWEEKKLGNLCETITKGTTPHKNNYPKEVHFIQVNDINKYNGNIKHQHYISLSEHLNYLKRSILKKGDILFSIAGSLGVVSVVKNKDLPANTNQALAILRLKKFHSVFFIDNLLKSEIVNKYIYDNPTVGAQPNLSLSQLYNFKLKLCCNSEQEKIGNFFTKLDRLIELQTKKVEQLKQLKRGYLQKMFPQKGETVPRLRFAGFIGEWEEKKLGDCIIPASKKALTSAQKYKLLKVQLHFQGVRITDEYPNVTSKSRDYFIRKTGELIVGKQNFHNGGVAIVPSYADGYIASSAIQSFNVINNNDLTYLYYFIARNDWLKRTTKYLNGTGQKEYGLKTLVNLKIFSPSLKEQKQLSNFFSNLDKKIKLQEKKLLKLKKMKKGYLQKMFC
ncbi:restriction endonuclease subunit S [Apilactobacillus xinyiensis]|uniref:restriction endonuclease subunit S n=1 Tax=Apilactobacillus xinyiensis TaxID=2841032 RepID=UPI001C7D78F7|nr:restriction endonuclease subunit S [Apilactobacillus xinyiensis]